MKQVNINLMQRDMMAISGVSPDDDYPFYYEGESYPLLKGKTIRKPSKPFYFRLSTRYSYKKYIRFSIVPNIEVCYDTQMEEGFETSDEIYYGYKQLGISLEWFGLMLEFGVNVFTGKWEK